MEQHNNENVIEESKKPSLDRKKVGFEIPTGDSGQLFSKLSSLNDSIDHDQAISTEILKEVELNFKTSKINIGNEVFTVEEAESIPDLELNMEIWEELRKEKFDRIGSLTYLPDGVAEFLIPYSSSGKFFFELPRLAHISDTAAKYISQYETYILLNGLKTISDNAAEYLGRSEANDTIKLDGLETLSDVAAEYLFVGRKKWRCIEMNGLNTLSDKALEYLSHSTASIKLNGLKTISEKGAEYISRHAHGLTLSGLTQISDEVAKHLCQKKCGISFSGLTSITDTTAKYLSEAVRTEDREGNDSLSLGHLTELSDEASRCLGHYRGYSLNLEGLRDISDETAKNLSEYKGWLYLNGLTDLSDKAAEYLSKLTNRNKSRISHRLSIPGVTNISDTALSFLKKYAGELYLSDKAKARMDKLK